MEALLRQGGLPYAETEGQSLIERARDGDAAAFEQLYLNHRDRIYALCLNLSGNREEAQDLLQETFVRAYQALPRFRGRSRFSTWLHRIAANLCCDAAHQQRRAEELTPPHPESSPRPTETVERVRATLGLLPPRFRVVLALRYGQTLSYDEIAETLNWSLPRVKVTIHRAKRAFKEIYLKRVVP
jgi:RNA polymerase sigma-70 factor (ECF subfamily)